MMLSALSKLAIKYDSLKDQVQMTCHLCSEHWNPDVQQRGVQFLALFNQEMSIQGKIVSTNPVFTEEQRQANPLIKWLERSGRKTKTQQVMEKQVTASSLKGSQPAKKPVNNATHSSMASHPLSNNPFFRQAFDRLCPNLINLLDIPSKLELKPYWKEALFRKTPFEGCQMKEKLQ